MAQQHTSTQALAIQLSSVTAPNESILIPIAPAREYQKLVKLTYHRLGKDHPQSKFDVHFHLTCDDIVDSSFCEARIDEYFYDTGEYFAEELLRRGRLSLYAHFSTKIPAAGQRQEEAPASTLKFEAETESEPGANYETPIELEDSPPPQTPPRTRSGTKTSQNKPKNTRKTWTGQTALERKARADHTLSRANEYPSIPDELTKEGYKADWKALMEKGPSSDSRHITKAEFRALDDKAKRYRAHALLIDGDVYGVPALEPCRSCVENGYVCRMYHPQVQGWFQNRDETYHQAIGWRCSMCRTHKRRKVCEPA